MSDLYEVIGSKGFNPLLADTAGASVIAIPCEPGNGDLDVGTLMYRKSSGLWAPAESGQVSTSYMLAVLNENVKTGSATDLPAGVVAEVAAAYRMGCFINGKVHLKSNGTVTEAHKVVLKLGGIVFNHEMENGTFDNAGVTITYCANNGEGEETVAIGAVKGSTHTVLNNSDSRLGFTKTGKTWSKWNTKADGSGTDYAAAASYTASADLTLYAVWAS